MGRAMTPAEVRKFFRGQPGRLIEGVIPEHATPKRPERGDGASEHPGTADPQEPNGSKTTAGDVPSSKVLP